MPNYDDSILGRMVRQTEPYHFQRSIVQAGSNFPRPPQAGIQPNQLRKTMGMDLDYWTNFRQEYEKETGIPAFFQPKRMNWRLL